MEELCRKLLEKGFDVWVMGASNQWALEAFSALYGIHPTRVIGARLGVSGGRLLPEVLPPLPYGGGKAEAVTLHIGRSPALIIADSRDKELLAYGAGLRILVVDEDRAQASPDSGKEQGWLVQPRFSPPYDSAPPASPR